MQETLIQFLGLGSSPREGIGYPLQYSWAPPVAQAVKNIPAMWETWVWFLGWKDPWRRAWQPTPVFLLGESPWSEESGGLQFLESQRVRHDWTTKHSQGCEGEYTKNCLLSLQTRCPGTGTQTSSGLWAGGSDYHRLYCPSTDCLSSALV